MFLDYTLFLWVGGTVKILFQANTPPPHVNYCQHVGHVDHVPAGERASGRAGERASGRALQPHGRRQALKTGSLQAKNTI